MLGALDAVVLAGALLRAVEHLGEGPVQDVVDQGGLARARDARHRREGQIGCWAPSMRSCSPGRSCARWSIWARARYRMSLTRVDLPEPETPVTAVKVPSGSLTAMPLRLCSRGLWMMTCLPLGERRVAGTAIFSAPERNLPVREAGWAAISPGVPTATT